ncbi:sulfite exporter TauE/SafE family protein [Pseudomonas sp. RTC3]|uniref:sulfite exporter TauE/SafE family protein n=1 Tax=unclassified Pseudomonas TaxID=196821 RepID=UPI002AB3E490|nr:MULTISPECIES: sulfite exporter TauE/SafE family protein [unclassified Pseudomonas]MEB0062711.1 sulfite exporter TauE/SafE family protein [Pseudomonas sp. RTC3]MDY7567584.1 sulfite exporter TauE/SafE family protein [Pseudomonas sp. 5C2]MEB0008583.1 sulfite exporter TauE/SafE family protein [Pseudomonas sp. RTB2]MEB0018390.1 sulfite exporter TauE/SafE family protein [Pseudomonas sp. RTB3]MEB0028102.1 sulfite exporter TauE/SafE family protein [Pseudomonas sp. MH9.2]
MEFLLYLLLGAGAGVLAGLFGVGGGIIIVPVLVYSFTLQGFDPSILTHLAVGTSLATIIFTSINAVREHHRLGAVRWAIFIWMTVGILVGAGFGALTAKAIAGPHLQKIIGVFAVLVALQLFAEFKPKASRGVPGKVGLTLAGTVLGWASAIFGIGGGSLTVPFLVWRSVPMRQAVATSSACGFPIAVASALSFMILGWHDPRLPAHSLGFIYLPALLGIALTSMIFARFGARLAHTLSPRLLKRMFAALLLCVGISFLVQ